MSDPDCNRQTSNNLSNVVSVVKKGRLPKCLSKGIKDISRIRYILSFYVNVEFQVWVKFNIRNFSCNRSPSSMCTSEVFPPCTWFLLNTIDGIINILELNNPKKNVIL